jgi:hypothetical protein
MMAVSRLWRVKMIRIRSFIAFAIAFSTVACAFAADDTATAPKHWFKGNLHTHSLWSDGNDFPEMIASWYRDNGYQFLALLRPQRPLARRALAHDRREQTTEPRRRDPEVPGEVSERDRAPNRREGRGDPLQPLTKVRELLEKPGSFS